MKIARLLFIPAVLCCMLVSCATRYVLTKSLNKPLTPPLTCSIGPIGDGLPVDMEIEKKPTLEEVQMLKAELNNKLAEKGIFQLLSTDARYEVKGEIIEFSRGSGGMRFLFGALAGSARLVIALKLIDTSRGMVLFSGNFKSEVTDWVTSGEYMYQEVASDFAKALDKQIKKLNKKQK
jgi:hypothetical protein